jgi:hypothetical protein
MAEIEAFIVEILLAAHNPKPHDSHAPADWRPLAEREPTPVFSRHSSSSGSSTTRSDASTPQRHRKGYEIER